MASMCHTSVMSRSSFAQWLRETPRRRPTYRAVPQTAKQPRTSPSPRNRLPRVVQYLLGKYTEAGIAHFRCNRYYNGGHGQSHVRGAICLSASKTEKRQILCPGVGTRWIYEYSYAPLPCFKNKTNSKLTTRKILKGIPLPNFPLWDQ